MITFSIIRVVRRVRLLALLALFAPAAAPLCAEDGGFDARITAVEGVVDVQFAGEADWSPAEADTPLTPGDSVRTDKESQAEIAFGDQTLYELQEQSTLALGEASASKVRFDLSIGSLLLHLRKLTSAKAVEVQTPAAVAAVRGTEFAVEAAEDGETSVGVYEGEVSVLGLDESGARGAETKVAKDSELQVRRGVRPGPPRPIKRLLRLRERLTHVRARRIAVRRDWKAMDPARRQQIRTKLREERLPSIEKRRSRLEQLRQEREKRPEKREGLREKEGRREERRVKEKKPAKGKKQPKRGRGKGGRRE